MQRITGLFLGFVLLCSVGCTSVKTDQLMGRYVLTEGGYNERLLLVLNPDQTYTLHHSVIFHDIDGRDEGSWAFNDGIVVLAPKVRGTPEGEMFLPYHCAKLRIEKNGNEFFLVSVSVPMIPFATRTRAVLVRELKNGLNSDIGVKPVIPTCR
ncbi:MAG: hypothetical protein Q8N18_14955 [Opitutaceae bacterium]|nr:hypothetical protein [Opitutaceae bacterium]